MISDAVIADHVLALYAYPGGPAAAWDYVQDRKKDDGISWALKRLDGYDLIVLEGTSSFRDFMRDLFATSDPFTYSPLGPLHFGFWDGMMEAWGIMRGLIKNPVVVTGHSLGAAHAAILAGIMVVNHVAPVRRVTFGEPRSGGVKLRDVIKDIPTTVYHNKYDVISDLPITLPLTPYCDSHARTEIHVAPHGQALSFGPFAWHHMSLYREGIGDVAMGKAS